MRQMCYFVTERMQGGIRFPLGDSHPWWPKWNMKALLSVLVSVCVGVCVWVQKDGAVYSSLHHFLMDKFPSSSCHALVVTLMTTGFLLLLWRAGSDSCMGRCQHVSHCSSTYRLNHMPPPPCPSLNNNIITSLSYCPAHCLNLWMNDISSSRHLTCRCLLVLQE